MFGLDMTDLFGLARKPLGRKPVPACWKICTSGKTDCWPQGTGNPLPQPLMWASYAQFLDTTGEPSSWTNASVASEIDWIGNGVDDEISDKSISCNRPK